MPCSSGTGPASCAPDEVEMLDALDSALSNCAIQMCKQIWSYQSQSTEIVNSPHKLDYKATFSFRAARYQLLIVSGQIQNEVLLIKKNA